MNTQFVTFKNLEVLNKWALDKENKYKGIIKRSVWLSEAGVNSRGYSDEELQKQAAGVAYAWKKVNALEGIELGNGIIGLIIRVMVLVWGYVNIWMNLIMENLNLHGMSTKKQTHTKKMNFLSNFYL